MTKIPRNLKNYQNTPKTQKNDQNTPKPKKLPTINKFYIKKKRQNLITIRYLSLTSNFFN